MKTTTLRRLHPLVLALGLLAGSAAVTTRLHAQTLLNGSFENPALTAGSSASGSGTNWTAGSGVTTYTNGAGVGTTPYGTQWIALNAGGSTDAQTVSSGFTLNRTYTFSLAAADQAGNVGDTLTVTISGGATASQTFAIPTNPNGFSSGALPFATYSLAFTPTTNAPVTFTLTSGNAGGPVAVDNAQLAVPEPSTWALLGLGVAGLGVVTLRRRRPRTLVLALGLLASAAATTRLHAQTLLNGSFENPALANGTDASGSGANWSAGGGVYVETNGEGSGITPYGNQYVILNPGGAPDAQTVSSGFTLNRTYTFSLAAADLNGATGDELTLTISGGATASQTFSLPANGNHGNNPLPFATYSLAFTPTSNAAVTFTLTSGQAGSTIAVDNAQINVVPEPSTWALLGVGLGALGLATRRQPRRAGLV